MDNLDRIRATTPQLQTKLGWLTSYALACGYIETAGPEDNAIVLDAFHSGGLVYRVSWWEGDHRNEQTHRLLSVARKMFKAIVALQCGR